MSDVPGVKHVTATATDGFASLTIEFAIETDTDRALNDIKDAVSSVRAELPDSAMEPQVQRLDVTGQSILTYAVSDPDRSIQELSYFVDEVAAEPGEPQKLFVIRLIGPQTVVATHGQIDTQLVFAIFTRADLIRRRSRLKADPTLSATFFVQGELQ